MWHFAQSWSRKSILVLDDGSILTFSQFISLYHGRETTLSPQASFHTDWNVAKQIADTPKDSSQITSYSSPDAE